MMGFLDGNVEGICFLMVFGILQRHLEYGEVPKMSQSGVRSKFSVFEIINCRRTLDKETWRYCCQISNEETWSWMASLVYLINIDILRWFRCSFFFFLNVSTTYLRSNQIFSPDKTTISNYISRRIFPFLFDHQPFKPLWLTWISTQPTSYRKWAPPNPWPSSLTTPLTATALAAKTRQPPAAAAAAAPRASVATALVAKPIPMV